MIHIRFIFLILHLSTFFYILQPVPYSSKLSFSLTHPIVFLEIPIHSEQVKNKKISPVIIALIQQIKHRPVRWQTEILVSANISIVGLRRLCSELYSMSWISYFHFERHFCCFRKLMNIKICSENVKICSSKSKRCGITRLL